MDETDISFFGSKKSKHDKADASGKNSKFPPDIQNATSEISVKPNIVSRATDEETYNTNNPHVGIALIFNHKEVKGQSPRLGTEKDRDTMKASLEAYGFDVRVHNDLTFEKINEELKETAKEDHSDKDCFVMVVMSHGLEGRVYAKDMSYPVERLWNPFLGDNCRSLINKPKLFFVQACRGENLEKPVVFDSYSVMSRELNLVAEAPTEPVVVTYAIPNTADMLVMYSTFEKFYSFRNVENGSWYIQSLCAVLNSAAHSAAATSQGTELLRLLTAVNRKVAYEYQSYAKVEALNQMKEMPNFMSTLTKLFYLKVKRGLMPQ